MSGDPQGGILLNLHSRMGGLVGGQEPGQFEKGHQARGGKLSLSGTQDHASPQTPWELCACRPKSRIFRRVPSAGCLAGATPTPATVSQLPGPWLQTGVGMWGGASFPRSGTSTSPPPHSSASLLVCGSSTPLHSQPPSLTDPCLLVQGPQPTSWDPFFGSLFLWGL